MTALINEIL